MVLQTQIRQVGDLRIAIAATLTRPDETVVDLTAPLTVEFTMVNSDTGAVKVAQTAVGVSVTSASDGEVQYAPVAADVDTEGLFHAYFVVIDATKEDTFPVTPREFQIDIRDLA